MSHVLTYSHLPPAAFLQTFSDTFTLPMAPSDRPPPPNPGMLLILHHRCSILHICDTHIHTLSPGTNEVHAGASAGPAEQRVCPVTGRKAAGGEGGSNSHAGCGRVRLHLRMFSSKHHWGVLNLTGRLMDWSFTPDLGMAMKVCLFLFAGREMGQCKGRGMSTTTLFCFLFVERGWY